MELKVAMVCVNNSIEENFYRSVGWITEAQCSSPDGDSAEHWSWSLLQSSHPSSLITTPVSTIVADAMKCYKLATMLPLISSPHGSIGSFPDFMEMHKTDQRAVSVDSRSGLLPTWMMKLLSGPSATNLSVMSPCWGWECHCI